MAGYPKSVEELDDILTRHATIRCGKLELHPQFKEFKLQCYYVSEPRFGGKVPSKYIETQKILENYDEVKAFLAANNIELIGLVDEYIKVGKYTFQILHNAKLELEGYIGFYIHANIGYYGTTEPKTNEELLEYFEAKKQERIEEINKINKAVSNIKS